MISSEQANKPNQTKPSHTQQLFTQGSSQPEHSTDKQTDRQRDSIQQCCKQTCVYMLKSRNSFD